MRKFTFNMFSNLPAREKRVTLATWITLIRVFLAPVIVGAMLMEQWGVAICFFIIASSTDLVDGALARWRNEKTFLGALLDPLADKILLLSIFFTLAFVQSPLFAIPQWFVWIVLGKEIVQAIGFFVVYAINGHVKIQPQLLGKLTTFAQIIFIIWLFACYFFSWVPLKTYYTTLGVLLLLVVASFIQYAYMGIRWVLDTRT